MATSTESITDLAAAPSQDPLEVVTDSNTELGVSAGAPHGISGSPENEVAGSKVEPHFGFSGSRSTVDDATFVPNANTVGSASQFTPGEKFSDGYQNEKFAAEGVIVESNLTVQARPDSTYDTERPK